MSADTGFGDHVYCVYGYNNPNDSFLVSLNFGNRHDASILMSYYLACWVHITLVLNRVIV